MGRLPAARRHTHLHLHPDRHPHAVSHGHAHGGTQPRRHGRRHRALRRLLQQLQLHGLPLQPPGPGRKRKYKDASRCFRDALNLDAANAEAKNLLEASLAFFSNNRAVVNEHLRKIHRRGIDLYVSGRIREAIKVWQDGRSLDREGTVNFSRDIEKAEKVLEVRGAK